jgi:hypothetical protein
VRAFRSIAADRCPHEVGVEAEPILLERDATQIRAVETALDDVASTPVAAAIARRDVDVDVDAKRYPAKDRIHGNLPAVLCGGHCRRAENT